ncbi:MAG: autophagy protein 13 [Pycnora praestabilis]|nr:MAG: autophagy protein 13 [Pycnora praestabilis]
MNQYSRAPPVTASPANSPKTNSTRTNNPRDPVQDRARPSPEMGGDSGGGFGAGNGGDGILQDPLPAGQGKESNAKLNQIIQACVPKPQSSQNYHTKAALIIISSRIALPPAYAKGSDTKRVNKWFNVEIDETDALRESLRTWKTCDAIDQRPPPLIIEFYLDTADLTKNQSLVIIDDQGKRWDVIEALNSYNDSDTGGVGRTARTQVTLEKWEVKLAASSSETPVDLGTILPIVYKKSIVLFRSLYTYSKFLPVSKFSKRHGTLRSGQGVLKVNYRILSGNDPQAISNANSLNVPLYENSGRVAETFAFGATESPAGPFSIQVSYRSNCDFRVDDSEAFLSSHFMGDDEHFFRPSLGRADEQQPGYSAGGKEIGSLPSQQRHFDSRPDRSQAYGSLSTFHQAGAPTGSSPISALRAVRDLNARSPTDSLPQKIPPSNRSAQSSKSSLRSVEGAPGMPRRPSVSFMPFKAPSLSASPSHAEQMPPPPLPGSLGRTSTLSGLSNLTQARNRTSLGALSPSSLRSAPISSETAIASSGSSSPKPAPITRYSSSFGHRRARLSSGGGSKTEDDNNSSGKGSRASLTSSAAQPGSGILAEGGGGSSSSIPTDDDNISDFIKLLETKKDLKSFHATSDSAAADASTRRTTAALSKFQRMRDSNAALSDSMSSSLLLHRSSSSSSRQLTSVPPMVAGNSMSTSSSPGKPISPHTPHTPAIPSRLSANSIVASYEQPHRSRGGTRPRILHEDRESNEDVASNDTAGDDATNAIDIPTSPRPYHPHNRRSSSVAQQHRAIQMEDETGDLFGIRSASLGDDRPPLSLSALIGLQEASEAALPPPERTDRTLQHAVLPDPGTAMARQGSSSLESREDSAQTARGVSAGSTNSPYRSRFNRGGGRGLTPPQGSSSSLVNDRGTGSGTSDHRGGRYSFSRPGPLEDDEPLLFAMSELGTQHSRRSLEDGRGGSCAGTSERGGGDSTSSSRRVNRRGAHGW